ncbi:MAG: FAD-dependent thymidylate synthase [Acidobacteria bacterium]|nr:FAD-dependent thymidylate synthase [Acidobacteriota bacterium]
MLQTSPPLVTLRNAPPAPFDGAIAAARTCYSPRVVGIGEITDAQRETIGALTFDAGHHTVYQHAHFEFGLENISRQFVWSFLHAHPFYNSEQSSQRYVRLNEPRAFVPPLDGEARAVYEQAILRAWDDYATLSALLKPDAFAILKQLRHVTPHASAPRLAGIEREAGKKAIEVARYVVPIAAFTSMVHTVSGITLYRLRRMMNVGDTPFEARQVIGAMVDLVSRHDPLFFERAGREPLGRDAAPETAFPRPVAGSDRFAREFDAKLGGRVSRLIDASDDAEALVADAVRATFGLASDEMSDGEAIDRVLNPARNRYLLDTLDVSHHSPLMRALHHVSYTFARRISHTADSQDQRHRCVPASRPLLTFATARTPDFITPGLVASNPAATARFQESMQAAWASSRRLLDLGVPLEFAVCVLPNALAVRTIETGPLSALGHKWTQRTCVNAPEEIYKASMDELDQVRAKHPRLARHIGPPCVVRNGLIAPRCTEGRHFCGVSVWLNFPNVERRL